MSKLLRYSFVMLLVSLVAVSCKKDLPTDEDARVKTLADYDYSVVHDWNEQLLLIERYAAGYRPGPISSSVGFVNLAAYESVLGGMSGYNSMAGRFGGLVIPQINASQPYHWPTVLNKVFETMYTRMFPKLGTTSNDIQVKFNENVDNIRTLYLANEARYKAEVSDDIILRSRNHGEAVALAVWDYWKTQVNEFDKYKDPFEDYQWDARNNPGRWVPTFPGPGKPMFPYWGSNKTFAISEGQKTCRPYENYIGKFSEEEGSGLYNQAVEVMIQQSTELAYQSEWVGEFWSDDLLGITFSPPLRFFAIADQVYKGQNSNLETAVFCNVKMGFACHDAGVGAWNSKYVHNLERPESYIQRIIDPAFDSALDNTVTGEKGITPSFPAFPSGHATFGGAVAAVLEDVFGPQYRMTDHCHESRTEFEGYPRSFESFDEMALENAWSRVPLGVHFRVDAEEGVRFGNEIGSTVNRLPWKK